MQWQLIFCVMLASKAASAADNDHRPRRDLQYLKNLIASNIFGIQQNNTAPVLVQDDGNSKVYRIPGIDNFLVRAIPKTPYGTGQVVHVEPVVGEPVQVVESYLGTKTIDETVAALQGIRNLLASGILIKPKPCLPPNAPKLPMIPVIPPPTPVPFVQEVIPARPLDYPEIIAIDVPNQYSYKQAKSDVSVTRWMSKDGGDVIVDESRQSMPLPPPYILQRLQQVHLQPIPPRPVLQRVPIAAARPAQFNVPILPLPPQMPVITQPSNVNVRPFEIRHEINVSPSVKQTDVIVPEPALLRPLPPALFFNKDNSPLFKQHKAFIGPVPIGSYEASHIYKGPNLFEPYHPGLHATGEVKVERIQKKGHTFLGTMVHQTPVKKAHHVGILERPAQIPAPPGPFVNRIENVVALAHAVHPPKVSAGYSFKIGSDIKNLSVNTDRSTVNNNNVIPISSPVSSYSYKQVTGDEITTFTGNEVNTNVPVAPNQVVVSDTVKEQEPKEVLFTSPVSSTYVYKQIHQNAAQPVTVVKVDNVVTENKQVYTHHHILADGSKKPCSEVHVNPVQEQTILEKKPVEYMFIPPHMTDATAIPDMLTVPILKIDSEKWNLTTNVSYQQLTKDGKLTNNKGNVIIREYYTNTPKVETTEALTLKGNPIVVVDESFFTTKEKRNSSTSSGKDKSDNVVSDEASDVTHKRKKLRGDIPDDML